MKPIDFFQPFTDNSPKLLLTILAVCVFVLLANLISQIKTKLANPAKQQIKNSLHNLINTCAISLIVLIFFRWQSLPFLNYKFWWLAVLIVAAVWLIKIIFYRLFRYKKDFLDHLKKQTYKKYLP